MNKNYLLLFIEPSTFTRETLKDFLESNKISDFWFYNLPNSIFIKSRLSAKEISDAIETKFGPFRHYITEVSGNRWGRLPEDHWKLF